MEEEEETSEGRRESIGSTIKNTKEGERRRWLADERRSKLLDDNMAGAMSRGLVA